MTELDVINATDGVALAPPMSPHVQRPPTPEVPPRIRTTWVLTATIGCAAFSATIAAVQMGRVMTGRERLAGVAPLQLALAVLAAVGIVLWTWMVVENARRLLDAGRTTEPPVPSAVAAAWAMPLLVIAAAATSVSYLESRLNTADSDTTSAVPLAIALSFVVTAMLVSYRPLSMLSSIMRRLGSASGALAGWIWVPISLVIAGAATLVGLRAGGAYGDDFAGVAPAWALGVVTLPPLMILLMLAWRGGRAVEDAVGFAFDRRTGRDASGVGRGKLGLFTRALRADARPAIALDTRKRIRIVPGADILRLALMTTVAALTLVSIVGALVMFMFWRESGDGTLLPSQRDRAWTALGGLQTLERWLAVGLIGIATIWSFVSVLSARIASGRRRNPVLAAAAWPAAAYGIWWFGLRLETADTAVDALAVYALQIAALYVPIFFLERAAVAVGARRGPLRLTFAVSAVLLIHVQGLGGLPTIVEITEVDRFGRLAGYLALAALLELIATIAITDSSHLVADGAAAMADKHNFLVDQRTPRDAPPDSGAPFVRPPTGRPVQAAPPMPSMVAASAPVPPPPTGAFG
ncbi:MAG: hypothetical protein ABJH68_19445 [Ilumatobacter sp.]|uniref:hypothetical protein n=1 Tax=Ilumatobacter sp. TaxID=1967498 RepID=UPI003299BE77